MAALLSILSSDTYIRRMLSGKPKLTADLIQSFNLLFGKFLRAAQLFGQEQKLRIEFYGFHLVICIQERIRISQSTVIRKQNRIKILQILGNRIRNFVR